MLAGNPNNKKVDILFSLRKAAYKAANPNPSPAEARTRLPHSPAIDLTLSRYTTTAVQVIPMASKIELAETI